MSKPSSLPTITITSPAVLQTRPAGLVPTVTPLPGPPPTTVSDAIVPTAAQVSELMVQATQDAVQ